ncbi:MAG: hypothetical protein NC078_04140 [Ruminococcus sp.]|nr:hypothetical protein [Ruminococcus sp.]
MEIPEQLARDMCYFLGTNPDDGEEMRYVASLVRFAFADLREKTGVNWLGSSSPNYDIALEIIRSKVYLSYYGNRDDSKNTEHLERFIAAKTFSLKYSKEAVSARSERDGSQ